MRTVIYGITLCIVLGVGGYVIHDYQQKKDALFAAVRAADEDGIIKAVKNGASLDARDGAGQTALHIAAYHGEKKLVFFLLRQGMDVDIRDSREATPLHWASINANLETIHALIDRGADVNALDGSNATPLYWAITGVSTLPVQKAVVSNILLNHYADPSIKNDFGRNAFEYAKLKKYETIVEMMLPAMR